jgi:hypothetical protein
MLIMRFLIINTHISEKIDRNVLEIDKLIDESDEDKPNTILKNFGSP